ncbi:cell wall-active antibiotics response protein LiaF [Neobacillus mesonae]|uniref:cell wall-active antibiotics response protein LiaF n=1 Tax=Neobacillus mesonae TaxID=1193713 RepID=UPI002041F627|nr:cell wall-active antibiotics response protein LiaF [Neobacillus mesonae]MCM3569185.1 cell wall-active antibiotics response protein LiaF [Neobacillus mesonae]
MFRNYKNDYVGWLVIFGVVILLLEILFFNHGLIFSLFVSGGMIYLGRKRRGRMLGKLLFYAGIFFFAISVFNMMTFKFLLLAVLLHFFIQYLNAKKRPNSIKPELIEPDQTVQQETLIHSKLLFENIFIGQQKTPQGVYEWNDVNIQTGIGDTVIDLSYTMLPKGETVIFIRNLIGNIQILVPYDLEVSVQHSSVIGKTSVFENENEKMFNQVFQVKTAGYDGAEQKVKIFTSLIVGNIEVSRI